MKKKKKFIIPIGILAIVLVLAIVLKVTGVLSGIPQGVPVTLGTVEVTDVKETIVVKGTVTGETRAELSGAPGYQVKELLVREGDMVKKDQVLARLVSGTQPQQGSASLTESARLEYIAAQTLYAEGAISRADYLKAKGAYENALLMSGNITLKSPFEGTVTRVSQDEGTYIAGTNPLIVVEDLSSLKMEVKINEYSISKVKVGQRVIITSEVLGDRKLSGVVERISLSGEQKDMTTSERVVPVMIMIDKEDSGLLSGVTAKAELLLAEANNVVSVPIDSVMEDPVTKEAFVFVFKDGIVSKTPVTLGVEGDFSIEVKGTKLVSGDQVVLNAPDTLEDQGQAFDLNKLRKEK